MTGNPTALAEVWCSKCPEPATTEMEVTDGTETYTAAYCGRCATNVRWQGQAQSRLDRRTAMKGAHR